MRTKTLLTAAALCVAGMVTTAAQVYSVNVVGYVNITIPTGFSLLANPLNNTEGNALSNLMPNAPFGGLTVLKLTDSGYQATSFLGDWDPDLEFAPGEGFWVNNESGEPFTITYVGEVMQGTLNNELKAGLNLVGSMVPAEESLNAQGSLGEFGDTILRLGDNGYVSYSNFGTWANDTTSSEDDLLSVGEGFWVNRGTAGTWTREFSVEQ